MEKYFSINESGHSIRCRLFCADPKAVRRAVLCCHGFGGSKDSKAAERFARFVQSKKKGVAVMTFDWPCHGDDAKKKLRLEDCTAYLTLCIGHLAALAGPENLDAYATSFGGYLVLKYLHEQGKPFRRIALRCPAVPMYDVLSRNILTEDLRRELERGREVLVGFERKLKIGTPFLEELRQADIRAWDYTPFCDDILILHGTKDEVVPFDAVRTFAEDNLIEFIPVEGADHRFMDPHKMDAAIGQMVEFLAL